MNRREFLGLLTSSLLLGKGFGANGALPSTEIRIGAVLPIPHGVRQVKFLEAMGIAAATGFVMGIDDASLDANASNLQVQFLMASSPSPEAATRASERLAAFDEVNAIVGGVGQEQAKAIASVAQERDILFLNIGSDDDALRSRTAYRNTFHVEASASTYLDACLTLGRDLGTRRWSIVHDGTARALALAARFRESLASGDAGETLAAEYSLSAGQIIFTDILGAFASSDAQRLLAIVDAGAQEALLAQAHIMAITKPITPLPVPASQSRSFLADLARSAGAVASSPRIALWESTATDAGAERLNERYSTRFGEPMDPAAWSAYQAARIIVRAAASAGPDTTAMVRWLEDRSNEFDVAKGDLASFREWDHQLRQPLHVLQIDPNARWGNRLSDKNAIASSVGLLSGSGR